MPLSLLEKLREDHNSSASHDSLLKSIEWLLNSVSPLSMLSSEASPLHAEVENSVLNYGLPPLAGATAQQFPAEFLQDQIGEALRRFEPRLIPDSIRVTAIRQNSEVAAGIVSLRIEASQYANPVPLELMIRTDIDFETGEVKVHEDHGI